MSLGNSYTRFVAKAASYTIDPLDDVVTFTTASPGVVATLPLAVLCTLVSGQNQKIITSAATSTNILTIAVQSGNTLFGATTASGTTKTIAAGETAFCYGDGSTVWDVSGGTGAAGVSGFSGFSGASGYSGFSGWSGFSGVSGYSGYSGISGPSGYVGKSGFSGYSGFSGISGYSGYSGVSGYSGYSGF